MSVLEKLWQGVEQALLMAYEVWRALVIGFAALADTGVALEGDLPQLPARRHHRPARRRLLNVLFITDAPPLLRTLENIVVGVIPIVLAYRKYYGNAFALRITTSWFST